ncbi:MAG TPA: hypothetical protein VMH36_11745 [Alphaproteobacteria bacterium]|nr:hypothetical protein [Alphaproteobacteria bacterium]
MPNRAIGLISVKAVRIPTRYTGAMDDKVPMRLYLIEAYGGPAPTDGKIEHFTVRAANLDSAIALIKRDPEGSRYRTFELIEESAEFAADAPAIIEAGEGPYLER